jgi:hypothetical protein
MDVGVIGFLGLLASVGVPSRNGAQTTLRPEVVEFQ